MWSWPSNSKKEANCKISSLHSGAIVCHDMVNKEAEHSSSELWLFLLLVFLKWQNTKRAKTRNRMASQNANIYAYLNDNYICLVYYYGESFIRKSQWILESLHEHVQISTESVYLTVMNQNFPPGEFTWAFTNLHYTESVYLTVLNQKYLLSQVLDWLGC